ncbi:MAG: hypothetical protein GIW96_12045 [Candidatus Eremiobacteraeota bacterium]|nr:hypothetical protein [Candidatus Eremiobacteraeota bacterium]
MIASLISVFAALVAAVASPGSAPSPTVAPLGSGWVPVPLEGVGEYARYIRHENDGTDSLLSAGRQVCDCQPDDAMHTLQSIFGRMKSVSVRRDVVEACGHTADRMLVTGLAATASSRRNTEVLMFRGDGALYSLTYTFRYPAPMSDAESALLTLCGGAH